MSRRPSRGPARATREDRAAGWRLCAAILAAYLVVTLADWPAWGAFENGWPQAGDHMTWPSEIAAIVGANLAPALVLLALLSSFGLPGRRWVARVVVLVPALAGAVVLRARLLAWLRPVTATADTLAAGTLVGLVWLTALAVIPLVYVDARAQVRYRDQEAARMLRDVEHTELRTRRHLAGVLHGTVQQHLVLLAARLEDLATRFGQQGLHDLTEETRQIAAALDELRETEVRQVSHALFPTGLDISLHAAMVVLAQRMAPALHVSVHLGQEAQGVLDDVTDPRLDLDQRSTVLEAVAEGLTNAVRHGGARTARIHLDLASGAEKATPPLVTVELDDDGTGPDEDAVESGLLDARARLARHGGDLTLHRIGRTGGARLRLTLPLDHADPGSR